MSEILIFENEKITKLNEIINNKKINNNIESFEKNWINWNIDDTIKWFKYIIYSNNNNYINNSNELNENSGIENESDIKNNQNENINENEDEIIFELDFNRIEETLIKCKFVAKANLPKMDLKAYKKLGFLNQIDCKLINEETKRLVQKYPKITEPTDMNKTEKNEKSKSKEIITRSSTN